jgi:hypothetical protein
MAVNVTKKEVVRPWDIGGVAKLWEWCVNRQAGIFPYLLRTSSGWGGGDIQREKSPQFAGRWAGDEVYLIGDYDESGLYEIADSQYRNISQELTEEYNEFVQLASCKLPI